MAEPRIAEGIDVAFLNARGAGHLPGWFGFEAVSFEPGRMTSRMLPASRAGWLLICGLLYGNGALESGSAGSVKGAGGRAVTGVPAT